MYRVCKCCFYTTGTTISVNKTLCKGSGVVSSLIRQIMEAKGLRQADLAELLGASIDRVKNITSGRVKKLSATEMQALVSKLHVQPGYLVSGEGPMFLDSQSVALEERLRNLGEATRLVDPLDLPVRYKMLVRDVVSGALSGQSEQLHKTIDGFVIDEVADRFSPAVIATPEQEKPGGKRKGAVKK